jgi:hypothetical protein
MFSFKNNQDVDRINEVAHPEAGATYPVGKANTENDALGDPAEYERNAKPVLAAKEETGVVAKCIHIQAGKQWDNMTQENSGVPHPDEY